MRYADYIMWTTDSERKPLQKMVNKFEKKALRFNWKRQKIWFSTREKSQHLNYVWEMSKSSKCEHLNIWEQRTANGTLKSKNSLEQRKITSQNLCKKLRNKKMLEAKNKCNVISALLFGSECWVISAAMEKKLETTEIWFHRRWLRIWSWE